MGFGDIGDTNSIHTYIYICINYTVDTVLPHGFAESFVQRPFQFSFKPPSCLYFLCVGAQHQVSIHYRTLVHGRLRHGQTLQGFNMQTAAMHKAVRDQSCVIKVLLLSGTAQSYYA